jgi:hypothetical protein
MSVNPQLRNGTKRASAPGPVVSRGCAGNKTAAGTLVPVWARGLGLE